MTRWTAATATASGTSRAINQDWAAINAAQDGTLFAVIADGLGSYTHSAEASALACDIVRQHLLAAPVPWDRRTIVSAVQAANVALWQRALDRGVQLKTTLSLLVCDTRNVIIAHVGDCRVYLVRDQALRQLTRDHSLAQEGGLLRRMVRPGMPSATRHRLNRVVGDHPIVQVDVAALPVVATDRFCLCSDGIWGALTEAELAEAVLTDAQDEQALADRLVQVAQAKGSTDDATAIIVAVRDAA
jgi:serine/threonine protein phosphatase PrpC